VSAADCVMTSTWLTFSLAGELFGLNVEEVQEVLVEQPLTPVPLAPAHVVGLLNLRGQIVQAIDLRSRLHFPPRAADISSCLMVVKHDGNLVSLVVDEIGDVLELKKDEWRSPPETLAPQHRGFVVGICPIAGQMVLGLRVASLVKEG
jgi:purine-binding chemotaxis protein CheW